VAVFKTKNSWGNKIAWQSSVLARFIACALMFISVATLAEGQRARLTVEVSVDGTESVVGNGGDNTEGRFHEGYTLVTYLKSSGDPSEINIKDPNSG